MGGPKRKKAQSYRATMYALDTKKKQERISKTSIANKHSAPPKKKPNAFDRCWPQKGRLCVRVEVMCSCVQVFMCTCMCARVHVRPACLSPLFFCTHSNANRHGHWTSQSLDVSGPRPPHALQRRQTHSAPVHFGKSDKKHSLVLECTYHFACFFHVQHSRLLRCVRFAF